MKLSNTSNTNEQQARNALRGAIVFLLAALINAVVASRQAVQSGNWQAWVEAGVVLVFLVFILVSIVLIRRRHVERGISVLIISFLITIAIRNALTANMGILYGLVALAITSALAFYTLSPDRAIRMVVTGLLAGILLVLFDQYAPSYRQPAPSALLNSLPYIAFVIVGVLIFLGAQRFRTFSLQTRLTVLVLATLIPLLVGVTVLISNRAGTEIERQANVVIQQRNDALTTNVSTWLELNVRTLQEMALLPDINSMDAVKQRPTLLAIAATHPNLFLVQTTSLGGINIARNDNEAPKDYHDRAWFLGAVSGKPITFEVLISRTTGKPALNMSTSIRNTSGAIVGVASIVSELDEISHEVLNSEGGRSVTFIVDANNRVVAHPNPEFTANELKDMSEYPPVAALRQGHAGLLTFTDENGEVWRAYTKTLDNGWGVIVQQPEIDLLAPVREFQRGAITFITIGMAVMLILAWWVIRRMLQPIGALTDTVTAIAAGDLNRTAQVNSQDEIGVLASTFNNMTAQLRDLIGTLEQRVADRTKALATSTEVSRRLSTILNRNELVTEVVNQVKNAFGYYHTQIYLYDEATNNLVMAGGTGEAGEKMLAQFHKVVKGRGLVGRAAESNKPILVPDTAQNPEWLPNPLLPDTKSEVAIPISIGNEVLGVLDVQHDITGGLQQQDVDTLQSIANQVAIALQNIQSTEIVAKRATELQTVATISNAAATIGNIQEMLETVVHLTQRRFDLYHAHVFIFDENNRTLKIAACGWKAGDVHEGTHGTAVILLEQEQSLVARAGRTRQAVIVNDVRNEPGWLPNPLLPDTASELAVPLIVGDQLLGVMDVQSDRINTFTEEDASIQTTLAAQIATALQNTRTYAKSQRQAERETAVNLITQKIQSTTTIENAMQVAVREVGRVLGARSEVRLEPVNNPQRSDPA